MPYPLGTFNKYCIDSNKKANSFIHDCSLLYDYLMALNERTNSEFYPPTNLSIKVAKNRTKGLHYSSQKW
ncbi:hypothetical protein BFS16_04630 [Hoylesella timonensis]|uniref:Uncharacterized protein n=1 Tax=Hoylesella timonensis TaxID=386414 RepID=A0A2K0XM82_9BACT|nr:hypothetical protein BFS16_04630 [Hoylesella timonensis]